MPETAGSAPDAAPGSQILASFNGARITVADMEAALSARSPSERAQLATSGGRERFLRELIRFDLLAQEAERRGYADHPAVIAAAKRAAISILEERDLAVDPASIPADEVKRYFAEHRAEYVQPAMRRAAHIQVATKAEAEALIVELRGATRERFSEIAGQRSQDPRTRRQGGELGHFDREGKQTAAPGAGAVLPELARAAFAQKRVGQISPRPVGHAAGFSVLIVNGELPAIAPKLSGLEVEIRAKLAEQRSQHARYTLLTKLREQHEPAIQPELLSAIALDPWRPSGIPRGFPAAPPDPRAPFDQVEPDGY